MWAPVASALRISWGSSRRKRASPAGGRGETMRRCVEDRQCGYDYLCGEEGRDMVVRKYVPNRDRPVQFELPGLR